MTDQRIVLLMQNEPRTVLTYLALARAGAVSVPVNPRLLADEIAFIIQDCDARFVIADVAFAATAADLGERCSAVAAVFSANGAGEDGLIQLEALLESGDRAPTTVVDSRSIALIIYTSGTSGRPKGVSRTHEANLWTTVNSMVGQPRFAHDLEVFVLPLFGIAFIFQVMPMILAGGTTVLDGAFDPARTWVLLERHRATRVFLAPTMIDSMLAVDDHESRDLSALRVVNTAYEFPERVRRGAVDRFGDIIAYMYGLTEAQLCVSAPDEFSRDHTDAGHPMGMMRVRVVDEARNPVSAGVVGEIALGGPSLMSGYHGLDEETAAALDQGWLYTGDLGYLDEAGHVHVAGRKKMMIKTGGFSVDPVEVENALLGFPGVLEAAVVGIPDEHWGEVVVAFISPPALAGSEAELLAFVKTRIAAFKCPKRIWTLSALPKNPTGKVERAKLRARALEASEVAGPR
jgi:acyl-CoA synthetase (AMP-forming)/AMP-acid ligase II